MDQANIVLSSIFKLNTTDLVHGAATAVAAGVLLALAGLVSQQNFDIVTVDWGSVLHLAVNAACVAFVGYLGKALVSDQNGKVFGKI